jgi:hypothetical protein
MPIPVARREGQFNVIGNFCSLECAAASNFDRRGGDLAWEACNMMINELSAACGNGLSKADARACSTPPSVWRHGYHGSREMGGKIVSFIRRAWWWSRDTWKRSTRTSPSPTRNSYP